MLEKLHVFDKKTYKIQIKESPFNNIYFVNFLIEAIENYMHFGSVYLQNMKNNLMNNGHAAPGWIYSAAEHHLYGSSRLGVHQTNLVLASRDNQDPIVYTVEETEYTTLTRGKRNYELSNHLGNVQVVITDKRVSKCDSELAIEYFEAEVLTAMDYYPFGMLSKTARINSRNMVVRNPVAARQLSGMMPDRQYYASNDSSNYRFGFNGMERDNEVSGQGNNLGFGARIYDSRLGRFLSVDPKYKKLPALSAFAYSLNSPIAFIDVYGELPKVAIILTYPGRRTDFTEHKVAMEKQGYKVVFATSGSEALDRMAENSSPESPIENLIVLSHGSPGGPNAGYGTGFMTESELHNFARSKWETGKFDEHIASTGVITDVNDPNYNEEAYQNASNGYEIWIEDKWTVEKEGVITQYKTDHKVQTTCDIGTAMAPGGEVQTKNLTIVLGGCNIAGYPTPDDQVVFATELATETHSTVYASQGLTEPDRSRDVKTNDAIGVTTDSRSSECSWIKTDSEGNRTNTGQKSLNLTNPSNE